MDNEQTVKRISEYARKTDMDLENALKASDALVDAVKASVRLLSAAQMMHPDDSEASMKLIGLFLNRAIQDFQAWQELPF